MTGLLLKRRAAAKPLSKSAIRVAQVSLFTSLALVSAQEAHAQSEGFAADRFDPSERGSDWFANESLDLRGHGRWALGVVGDWGYLPLVVIRPDGAERKMLRHQAFAHAGLAVNLWERVRVGVNLPLLVLQRGVETQVGGQTFTPSEEIGIGDVRLGVDLRIAGDYGDPVTLAVGVQGYAPTGDEAAFSSDGKLRIAPRAMMAGDLGMVEYALQAAFNYRGASDEVAGEPFGSEVRFGGAIGLRLLDEKLLLGPEIYGSTVADSKAGFLDKEATPFEALLGAHLDVGAGFRIGLGGGPGLTAGLGSPKARFVASLEWFPDIEQPAPLDTDGDGIIDLDDACVALPGEASEDPSQHGCPPPPAPPADSDGDGILDKDDACVEEPGEPNEDKSKHGCPPPSDTDGDGILDEDDACVDEPGEPNEDESKHGCPPPPDTDGDGILDEDDACVDEPGVASDDKSKHGCPKAKIVGKEVKIMDRIEFATGKAVIRAESDDILNAVFRILVDHPEIQKLSVEGHTDNRGSAWFNRKLSRKRAAAVVEWLVGRGIDVSRLSSSGFGPDKPFDSNETADGRQNNRRVEFHITKQAETDEN